MAKGEEALMSKTFIQILEELNTYNSIFELKENVKIMSDLTCLQDKISGIFKLGLGFAETDLTYYHNVKFDKRIKELNTLFKFIQDDQINDGVLKVPFVIIELKSGKITSDAIRARSIVAQRIKNVFPFCSYFFIGQKTQKTEETLLRQGKDFDSYFIFKNEIKHDEIMEIYREFIKPKLDRSLKDWKLN